MRLKWRRQLWLSRRKSHAQNRQTPLLQPLPLLPLLLPQPQLLPLLLLLLLQLQREGLWPLLLLLQRGRLRLRRFGPRAQGMATARMVTAAVAAAALCGMPRRQQQHRRHRMSR
jgi:hypothetical protein